MKSASKLRCEQRHITDRMTLIVSAEGVYSASTVDERVRSIRSGVTSQLIQGSQRAVTVSHHQANTSSQPTIVTDGRAETSTGANFKTSASRSSRLNHTRIGLHGTPVYAFFTSFSMHLGVYQGKPNERDNHKVFPCCGKARIEILVSNGTTSAHLMARCG